MQNWYDPAKETEAAKWIKQDKEMACLRASLSPAARSIYKYTTGLVVAALREFYRRVRRKTEFSKLIASWETRIRNQGAQSEYQKFADKLMRDQFIAGLISETLRVKLIGKDTCIGTPHKQGSL